MKHGKVLFCMLLLVISEVDPVQNLVVMRAHTTNQQKHYDYVTHAWSISIKHKMCRVKNLPT